MNILVLNCGSSSVKFQLVNTSGQTEDEKLIAKGVVERIGTQSIITLKNADGESKRDTQPFRNHKQAIDYIFSWLVSGQCKAISSLNDINGIGHRVVHGGEFFKQSVLIDESVKKGIEDCIELAPLHNPANLSGIDAIRERLGEALPQVAVFDTAFHSQMPESSFLYAVPYQLYRRYKLRKYGFHGTSHRYISYRYRKIKEMERKDINIISIHLGNGCSICAVQNGISVDTTMGLTPTQGLVMGTRSGDVDSGVFEFLQQKEAMSIQEIDSMLNKQSGLLGISGLTHDMRELLEEEAESNDRRAKLAIDIFAKRIRQYIGAYMTEFDDLQAVVFAGGIGENSPVMRGRILRGLSKMGIEIDESANASAIGSEAVISTAGSPIEVRVIPTNEELMIARDTAKIIQGKEI